MCRSRWGEICNGGGGPLWQCSEFDGADAAWLAEMRQDCLRRPGFWQVGTCPTAGRLARCIHRTEGRVYTRVCYDWQCDNRVAQDDCETAGGYWTRP